MPSRRDLTLVAADAGEGPVKPPKKKAPPPRTRMTGKERREQLLDVGRSLFAEKGYEGTSVEEIAARAGVSKPVVYEHFGGKEGLYAVVVDREVSRMLGTVTEGLSGGTARELLEQAAMALLSYVENDSDGFRILVRDSPVASASGTFASLISDIAGQVEHILGREFKARGFDPAAGPDVLPDAGRHGRADRPVVARRAASPSARWWPPTWSTWPGTACPAWSPDPG